MKNNYIYEIQPQEVDTNRRLRLYTMENYLLNAAGKASEEQGYGLGQLLPYGYTWIITRLHLELSYLPTHHEWIRIETWIEQNVHMLSTRDYRIYLTQPNSTYTTERLIGRAKSIWAILDMQKREIVNAFDLPIFHNCVDGEIIDMPQSARLVPIVNPQGSVPYTIQYSDCDYNKHCNSCKYLERMLDAHFPTLDSAFKLDIRYIRETHIGECISTRFVSRENDTQYQQVNESGQTICTAHIVSL